MLLDTGFGRVVINFLLDAVSNPLADEVKESGRDRLKHCFISGQSDTGKCRLEEQANRLCDTEFPNEVIAPTTVTGVRNTAGLPASSLRV